MPPIPIHKNDPIQPAATKPDGITPQTADQNDPLPPPTRTLPASVPATTTADPSNPPPPQPGARPIPPTAVSNQSSSSPPAPQPSHAPGYGGSYTATHVTTETRQAGPPEQFHHPPPTDSQLAGRYTTTATTASKPGPTTLNLGPAAPSPFQNEHSQGGVTSTRTSSEGERRSLEHPPGYVQAPDNAPYTAGGGIGSQQDSGPSDNGVGGAAWNMLSKAGEALKKGEEAAWRAVRNK